jgi:FkbM family methyltransferase
MMIRRGALREVAAVHRFGLEWPFSYRGDPIDLRLFADYLSNIRVAAGPVGKPEENRPTELPMEPRGRSLLDRMLLKVVPLTPLRSPKVRRATRTGRRHLSAWRRKRAERRGDDRLSRPGLYHLDTKLSGYLQDRGYFVEAGAYDGFHASNTYFLERFRSWSGLLIEAVPELHEWACRERPSSRVLNYALVSPDLAGDEVTVHYAGTMSIVSGARGDEKGDHAYLEAAMLFEDGYEVKVRGRTLSELLDEAAAPEVDFLSLDIEGYEMEALRGLDLERHRPRLILVEAHTEKLLGPVAGILESHYRQIGHLTPQDVLFERT